MTEDDGPPVPMRSHRTEAPCQSNTLPKTQLLASTHRTLDLSHPNSPQPAWSSAGMGDLEAVVLLLRIS
jgi:hypothetical protein